MKKIIISLLIACGLASGFAREIPIAKNNQKPTNTHNNPVFARYNNEVWWQEHKVFFWTGAIIVTTMATIALVNTSLTLTSACLASLANIIAQHPATARALENICSNEGFCSLAKKLGIKDASNALKMVKIYAAHARNSKWLGWLPKGPLTIFACIILGLLACASTLATLIFFFLTILSIIRTIKWDKTRKQSLEFTEEKEIIIPSNQLETSILDNK